MSGSQNIWRKNFRNGKNLGLALEGKAPYKAFSKEYWDDVDRLKNEIHSYGLAQYKKGNRVIVEGIQIVNGWLFDPDEVAGFMRDNQQPYIALQTDKTESMRRGAERDSIDLKQNKKWVLDYTNNSRIMETKMREVEEVTDANQVGRDYIEKLLNR